MFGWSISASACRSASKRATTCRVSMPSLMTLSATRRDRLALLGHPDRAEAAFADLLEQLVAADDRAEFLRGGVWSAVAWPLARTVQRTFRLLRLPNVPQLRNELSALGKALQVSLQLDVLLVPAAQIPFGQQQLSQEHVLVNRLTARQEVFDPRLVAGKPGRFERVTNRVHTLGRRRRSSLVAV